MSQKNNKNAQVILLKRCLSFAFDFTVILTLWVSLNFNFSQFVVSLGGHLKFFPIFELERSFTYLSLFGIFPTCFIGYFSSCYYFSEGQTLGKSLFNIKIEGVDFTLKQSIYRASLQMISYLLFSIPNIFAFMHSKQKSLIDIIMSSVHRSTQKIETQENLDNVIFLSTYEWDFQDSNEHELSKEKKVA